MLISKIKKIKLCFIVGNLPPVRCGVGDYTYKLLNELAKNNYLEIYVITSKESDIKLSNVKIYNEIHKWNLLSWKVIKKIINKIKPNIIHYQHPAKLYGKYPFQFYLPYLIKRNFKDINFLTTIHEFSEAPLYAKPWLNLLLKLNDYLIFTNSSDQEKTEKIIKVQSTVIPIGSNIEPYEFNKILIQQEREELLKNNKILLGYFGTINKDKGLDILIKALNYLVNIQKKQIKLCVIGELSKKIKYHKYIKSLINKLKSEDNVFIAGYQGEKNTSKYFNMVDICVLPFKQGASLRRGSLITSFIHGIPTITTPSFDNILKENENIVYFNNFNDLVIKINKLIEDKNFYQKIKNGACSLKEYFAWPSIAKKTFRFYRSILSNSKNIA